MPVRGDRFSRELNLKTRDLNWQDRFWPVTSVCFIRLRWENREIIKLLPSTKFWSESKMLGTTRCKELWTFLCFAPYLFLGSIATTSLRISWFHVTREYSEDGSKFVSFGKLFIPLPPNQTCRIMNDAIIQQRIPFQRKAADLYMNC